MAGGEGQTSVAVSYKLVNVTDTFETFVLHILGELLMSGPNAPFYKSLLEPQFGSSFSPSCGYDSHTRNTTFTVGLQGVKADDVEKVRSVIDATFDQVIEEGFPAERIEAVLHNIELSIKHQTSNFGLGLAMGLTPLWNLDGDAIDALQINRKVAKFRKCLQEKPNFLQEKVKEYFLDNTHKYTLTMSPRENFEVDLQKEEEMLLSDRVSSLTEEDRLRILEQGQILAKKQEEEEDLSSLPTLQVSDISRNVSSTPLVNLSLAGGVPLQICDQPTNGITYFSAVLDTQFVPEHLRSLIPLLSGVLTRMGAGSLDFRALDQEIDLVTGGLGAAAHLCPHPVYATQYEQGIILSSHCLNHNLVKMLDLWTLIFNEVKLDDIQRFSTLVNVIAADLANGLVYSGHRYAMTAANATTSQVGMLTERWMGLTNLRHMKTLSEAEDLSHTLDQLRELSNLLLSRRRIRVAVNTTPDNHDGALHRFENFLANLEGEPNGESSLATVPESFTPHTCKTHHEFPFPVNFASKAYPGVPYAHPDAGALRVLARLMFRFLHREIREKGGAYGGGAVASPGGSFSFYSYRDPHSTQTLATFDAAVEWVLSGGFNERDVSEAKLGVFQSVDSPVSPASKGKRQFLSHISDELFAEHRRLILDADAQDLVRVARTYLRDGLLEGACLIGPPNEDISKDHFWNTVCS